MADIVRIFQEYATTKGWIYSHGRKSNLNLLSAKTTLDNNKIYLLHEPSQRRPEKNSTGTGIASFLYTGHFSLVVKSEMDMPYFTEMDNPEERSKFVLYIEPLLAEWKLMLKSFYCNDLGVVTFDAIEAVNVFDENRDGLIITYAIRSTS